MHLNAKSRYFEAARENVIIQTKEKGAYALTNCKLHNMTKTKTQK